MAGIYTVQQVVPMMTRGEMSNQSIVNRDFTSNQNTVPGYANWLADTGYDGAGVIVSIIDSGIRTSHQDLVGQFLPCISQGSPSSCTTSNSNHGTHVAGAVAGTGASGATDAGGFLRGQGVAPGARLIQQIYNSPGLSMGFGTSCSNPDGPYCISPSGILTLFREAQASGAVLSNNSWGSTGIKIGYDLPSQQVDVVTRDANPDLPGNQSVLPVWSIQNGSGTQAGACGGNTLGAPDEAKNLFGVGSTQLIPGNFGGGTVPNPSNFYNISWNSAHGPACDGRIGLHIVAPGCATDSTGAGSDSAYIATFCGTSMASPVASGALAVFVERYRELFDVDPSPALMKAAMMAVASNMQGNLGANGQLITDTPSRFQGFGRIDLDAAVNPSNRVMYFDQETTFTATGQTWTLPLVADDPDAPVRLMLVWTDAHGSGLAGATPAWVNLLDLVVDADSGLYRGNRLGPDGFSQTGGVPDDRNNMEAVFLRPDQHNGQVFDVSVNAANIVADALSPHAPGSPQQDFALVCYNCQFGEDTFTLAVSPSEIDMCLPASGSEDRLIDVTVGAIAQYRGTVALSAVGEPAGVSSGLNPEEVDAPGSSVWTLSVSNATPTGSHLLELIGDDSEQTKSTELVLRLDAFLAAGPALAAPANGLEGVILRPAFAWAAQAGAESYRLQVASDSDFDDILIDEMITAAEFQADFDLALGTEYFWRVAGNNLCGQGDWSPSFRFTTRLDPVAVFSAESFSIELPQNGRGDLELEISNAGSGVLNWSIGTDDPSSGRSGSRFAGDFSFPNWQLVNSPSGAGGSFSTVAGPPAELQVTGGNAGVAGNTDFQIEVLAGGTIHFDWGYQSSDFGDFDSGGFVVNGTYTQLANNASQVPFFNQSHSVEVAAGDVFAFRVNTFDGLFGAGVFGATNFLFQLSVCGDELMPVDWLMISPEGGSVSAGKAQTAEIAVSAVGLAEGEYTGYLCVTTNAENAPVVAIEVTLSVTDEVLPLLLMDVQPASLELTIMEGQQTELELAVGNLGDDELLWQLEQTEPQCELADWLFVTPDNGAVPGGETELLAVTIDAGNLVSGFYAASICLSSNDPQSGSVVVPVEILVVPEVIFQDRFESP